jgi:predicted kinase
MTEKTYARLLSLGITLANQGYTVILDAKYDKQQLRQEAIAQANKHQLKVQIIQCTAPLEVLQQRLRDRTGDIADATVDLLESQLNVAEPFTEEEKPYLKILDTTQPQQAQLKEVIRQ